MYDFFVDGPQGQHGENADAASPFEQPLATGPLEPLSLSHPSVNGEPLAPLDLAVGAQPAPDIEPAAIQPVAGFHEPPSGGLEPLDPVQVEPVAPLLQEPPAPVSQDGDPYAVSIKAETQPTLAHHAEFTGADLLSETPDPGASPHRPDLTYRVDLPEGFGHLAIEQPFTGPTDQQVPADHTEGTECTGLTAPERESVQVRPPLGTETVDTDEKTATVEPDTPKKTEKRWVQVWPHLNNDGTANQSGKNKTEPLPKGTAKKANLKPRSTRAKKPEEQKVLRTKRRQEEPSLTAWPLLRTPKPSTEFDVVAGPYDLSKLKRKVFRGGFHFGAPFLRNTDSEARPCRRCGKQIHGDYCGRCGQHFCAHCSEPCEPDGRCDNHQCEAFTRAPR